ncbi:MAG: biopolymer transporter ExbD [Planctomycetes bacterium]|nr:biopolymer transporter ExbD [Planctomycetota bacterium]
MNNTKLVQQNVDMDMTPMIDCVFLLMIFFVLVIDLSQKSLEDLILPRAVFIEPDDKPPDSRPIINVLQNGSVVYNKEVFYDPSKHGTNYAPIKELLLTIRKKGLLDKTLHLKAETVGGGATVNLIDDPILLRADKWTEWNYIGEVMKQCSQPDVAFWKVELAMSEQDKETKEKNPRLKGGQ